MGQDLYSKNSHNAASFFFFASRFLFFDGKLLVQLFSQ